MPKVHYVKRARKKNPVADVGEPYYWWKFNYGPKIFSKTPAKRSQLTQSPFLSTLYDLQDDLTDRFLDINTVEEDIATLIEELQGLRDGGQESLDAMPEQLQETNMTGEMLQERIDNLESWISDLEGIDVDIDEDLSDKEREERFDEIINSIEDTDNYF